MCLSRNYKNVNVASISNCVCDNNLQNHGAQRVLSSTTITSQNGFLLDEAQFVGFQIMFHLLRQVQDVTVARISKCVHYLCIIPIHKCPTFLKHGITRNRNFLWLPAHPYFSSRHNCHDQVQHSKNKRQLRSNPDDRSSRVVPWLPLPSRSLEIFAAQKAQASDFEQQLAGKTPSSCSKHLEELSAQIKSTCYVSSGWF